MDDKNIDAPPCDKEIFKSGNGICSFHARTFIAVAAAFLAMK